MTLQMIRLLLESPNPDDPLMPDIVSVVRWHRDKPLANGATDVSLLPVDIYCVSIVYPCVPIVFHCLTVTITGTPLVFRSHSRPSYPSFVPHDRFSHPTVHRPHSYPFSCLSFPRSPGWRVQEQSTVVQSQGTWMRPALSSNQNNNDDCSDGRGKRRRRQSYGREAWCRSWGQRSTEQ